MTVEIPEDAWLTMPDTPITTDEIRSGLRAFRDAERSAAVLIDARAIDVIDDADPVAGDVSDDALAAAARAVTDRVESLVDDTGDEQWEWETVLDDPKHGTTITLTLTDSNADALIGDVRAALVETDDPALVDATADAIDATAYVITYAALRATTGYVHGIHHVEAVINRSKARRDERRERYSDAAEARERARNPPEPESEGRFREREGLGVGR
jgi:hypothetical protein